MSNKKHKPLLLCCFASNEIGVGHVMRCLTLAQQLKREGLEVLFLTNSGGNEIIERFSMFSFLVEFTSKPSIVDDLLDAVQKYQVSYAVWDSYTFSEAELKAVAEEVPVMILDDDYRLQSYPCDAILNQNLYADASRYRVPETTTVLAGASYVMLREQFLQRKPPVLESDPHLPRILLTFGGSDPDNLTCMMLELLFEFPLSLELNVILGPHYASCGHFFELLNKKPQRQRLNHFQNVIRMSDVMAANDLAVCAGGSTLYELAYLGIPSFSIVTADNQWELANKASELEFSRVLGRVGELDKIKIMGEVVQAIQDTGIRRYMSHNGKMAIDGLGTKRVAQYIKDRLERRR